MNDAVYRILYCSRNVIADEHPEAQIIQILNTARANNARQGVSGALLFNSGYFAQVLEGPQAAVERIFEKIQRDERHGDVTVLESGYAEQRTFPEWSMAYAQPPSEVRSKFVMATLNQAMLHPGAANSEVVDLLHTLVRQDE